MSYVDGFVTPVPNANKQLYIEHSRIVGAKFRSLGATAWVQCWADEIPEGQETSFGNSVRCEPDESVCFAWITWPSKDVRNQAMAALRTDKEMANAPNLFDRTRMIVGGFEAVVDL